MVYIQRNGRGPAIKEILSQVVDAILDKKGERVMVLDLMGCSSITDYFIVCHGLSSRQVQAISDRVEERLKEVKVRPAHVEGYSGGEWILLDYLDFVVHIFTEDKRNYYELERLWSDAPRIPVEGHEVTSSFDK